MLWCCDALQACFRLFAGSSDGSEAGVVRKHQQHRTLRRISLKIERCLSLTVLFLLTQSKTDGFFMWVGWTTFFTMLAASAGHLISPFADGSGLPQIKSILGGSPLRNFFGWPVMFAKAIGCFFGLAAGLTMGKEVCGRLKVPFA